MKSFTSFCIVVIILLGCIITSVYAVQSTLSSVKYTEKEVKTSIITSILNAGKIAVGLEPELIEENKIIIDVEINGNLVATIPKGSKFEGMDVHEECLLYQYGTDNWYWCEVNYK